MTDSAMGRRSRSNANLEYRTNCGLTRPREDALPPAGGEAAIQRIGRVGAKIAWSGKYLQILQNEANGGKPNRCEEIVWSAWAVFGTSARKRPKRGEVTELAACANAFFHGFVCCQALM